MKKSDGIVYIFWFITIACSLIIFMPKYLILLDLGADSEIDFSKSLNEYRKTTIQLLGGIVVVLGLYFTWRRVKSMEEQQISERFVKAIENLDNENLAIRLGGIFALERIAKDSEEDQWRVLEVLLAFIRSAPHPENFDIENYEVPTDIQTAINVLKDREIRKGMRQVRINLRNSFLVKADLSDMDLSNADFYSSNLTKAFFYRSKVYGVSFIGANLNSAHFYESRIEYSRFIYAKLMNALFHKAKLINSNFAHSDLTSCSFGDAKFSNTEFKDVDLARVDFENSKLSTLKFKDVQNLKRSQIEMARDYSSAKYDDTLFQAE